MVVWLNPSNLFIFLTTFIIAVIISFYSIYLPFSFSLMPSFLLLFFLCATRLLSSSRKIIITQKQCKRIQNPKNKFKKSKINLKQSLIFPSLSHPLLAPKPSWSIILSGVTVVDGLVINFQQYTQKTKTKLFNFELVEIRRWKFIYTITFLAWQLRLAGNIVISNLYSIFSCKEIN